MAEEALKKLIKERHPKEASVIIMNPKTGEILANATYPNYDPNIYWKFKNQKNVSFHNAYEIGSLAKPFILATAIEDNQINLKQSIYCGNGKIIIDKVRIKDHKRFKYLTPAEILIHSSNIGTIKIAMELDPDKIYKKYKDLGFGEKTGIFPGEASGIFRPFKRRIDVAYASIGQSWTATPIQVAVAYSSIANGGYRIQPRLVKGFVDSTGKYLEKTDVKVIDKVLDDKSVKWLKKVLTLVVEEGTARSGKSKYFTIAGKTGTAQKYDPKIKALSNEKFYTWFAGFFPVSNPEFTIVVFANEPKKIRKWEQIGGGKVSSTVLNNLIERLMFYYREKPDKTYN
jgi:cell division protein FtsI (penicillin-binding protein 3)